MIPIKEEIIYILVNKACAQFLKGVYLLKLRFKSKHSHLNLVQIIKHFRAFGSSFELHVLGLYCFIMYAMTLESHDQIELLHNSRNIISRTSTKIELVDFWVSYY